MRTVENKTEPILRNLEISTRTCMGRGGHMVIQLLEY